MMMTARRAVLLIRLCLTCECEIEHSHLLPKVHSSQVVCGFSSRLPPRSRPCRTRPGTGASGVWSLDEYLSRGRASGITCSSRPFADLLLPHTLLHTIPCEPAVAAG
ncbi:hypothetical protein F4780DRAFT_723520 [Xylariomycetidae sp. FL0641]|nr:hypothetical protein F4780DRAFT_723520 [Xylariomycetidae sp. FL0641]